MNSRPTSFLLRDKITFSEQESRYLKKIQKHQKHHHEHLPPEFSYGTDETQTEIIPTFDPIPPVTPPVTPPTPPSGPPTHSAPSDSFNAIGWGPHIYDLGSPIPKKVLGTPLDTTNVNSMIEEAEEALALLGV